MYFGKRYKTVESSSQDKLERRTEERNRSLFYFEAWNADTNTLLGHLVDINTGGLMLLLKQPTEVGVEYRIEIRWTDGNDNPQKLTLRVESRWCKPDTNPSLFAAGFRLLEKDPEIITAIEFLVREAGF